MVERLTRKCVDWDKYASSADPVEGHGLVPAHDSLLQFETETATYHFHPGNHSTATALPSDVTESIDAIVLEEGFDTYEALSLDEIYASPQYETTLEQCLSERDLSTPERELPVFIVDLPSTIDDYDTWDSAFVRRLYATIIATLLAVPVAYLIHPLLCIAAVILALPSLLLLGEEGAQSLLGPDLPWETSRLRAYAMMPWWYTVWSGRSAIVAHKLERFVAPKLASDLGRKPEILIDYGAAHIDMYHYLCSRRLRHFVLGVHRRRNWGSKDETYVDRILEFQFTSTDRAYRNRLDAGNQQYKKLLYELRGESL